MQRRWNWTAIVFILFGMAVSIYLVVHHYNLIFALSETKSFCTLSSKIDCDAVNTSRFSEVLGVPVAMVQVFVLLVGLLLLAGMRAFSEDEKPLMARFFLYLTSLNLFATVFMGAISTFVLKTFCLMCGSLYLVALVIWFCSLKLNPKGSFGNLFNDFKGLLKSGSEGGTRGFFILFLMIPVGSAIANGMYQKSILSSTDFEKMIDRSLEDWKDAKLYDFKTTTGAEAGNPSANFRIVEFYDYQCPHCKRASPSIHAFVNAHRDDVHLAYQNYPLDKSCNPRGGEHEFACALARGALCALKQNKFIEAHDWIFDHQDILSQESVTRMADEIGLGKDFEKCLNDPAIIEELKKEIDLGNSANLEGTPSIFVNGRLLPGGFLIPVLEAALVSVKK